MAEAKKPSRVKLVIGVIVAREGVLIQAKKKLARKFGWLDFQSPSAPFNCTDYYQKQMGPNLQRQFLSFEKLINPQDLAAIKLYTNRLEQYFARRFKEVKRPINLDPGYLTESNLVLASAKPYAHRVYLKGSIYAEVTLIFRGGTYQPLVWTYPDYRTPQHIEVFNNIRKLYKQQIHLKKLK